ncbi:unnamed protein product [Zymoseptoria tritici ST99CH_1A5]|uniref:Cytochrome P450 n=1 Tax=Zymoseptoria tritici ST99CH_1A5 TaxID=1276529 RepID=A0A1Y6L924_ZYMTR|nr:unnamed protein product [Zymoseptoria tritici ST99CH_3D1]SMY20956.1 unnamed protein product [Zymoseptoria tritici ST99CH_1A5]
MAEIVVSGLLLYFFTLAVYRLYFSPLAKIPGPKLAALTLWYEFYYDVVLKGQYTWKIGEMHEKYGPIVRINPFEIHINDPDYYNEIYAGPTRRREKWAWSAAMFGNSSSHFGTIPHELHRRRRAPLNPFFSRASVTRLEPMLRQVVEDLSTRLEQFRESQKPVNLRHAFAAVTMDVVTDYAFGTSYKCLEQPDFAPMWAEAIDSVSEQSHMNKQFPIVLQMMRMMPLWVVERTAPDVMRLIKFQMDMATQVSLQMSGKSADNKVSDHPTIFHELLQPGALPESEQTLPHLVNEAQSIVAAGQVTTTHYLNTTAYHILAREDVLKRLKAELKEVMSDGSLPSWQALEQLPYLSAVVLEGYRMSHGPVHRLQRVAPDEDLVYKDYVLPPGTPVGMTSIFIHENPSLFPDPRAFKPERWLEPGAKERLSNYLVNFSKGTRGCLGMYLAQAEIYLTLAAVFGRFDMEIFETTRADIDVAHDFFNPQPRKGSVGLRVLVK